MFIAGMMYLQISNALFGWSITLHCVVQSDENLWKYSTTTTTNFLASVGSTTINSPFLGPLDKDGAQGTVLGLS